MGKTEPVFLNLLGAQESIPSLAGPYGTTTLFDVPARQATLAWEIDSSESIYGLFKRLQIRALYKTLREKRIPPPSPHATLRLYPIVLIYSYIILFF
jgi:hypothetical protein